LGSNLRGADGQRILNYGGKRQQIKAIPGRKTDELDSQWLARVFRAGLVKPSYMPEKKIGNSGH